MRRNVFLLLIFLGIALISVKSQTSQFWGMTTEGGENGLGVIFKTDGTGENFDTVYNWFEYDGAEPVYTHLCKAVNGKLYGMTSSGGANSVGVIFEYDPLTNTYSKKFDFDNTNGSLPSGSLIEASNGKLYGMATEGGVNGVGVIFEYDPKMDTFVKKYDFDWDSGVEPVGSLLQADNGKLYGMTNEGGANGDGVIFEYDIETNIFTKIFDFDQTNTGSFPYGSLMQADNGKLYGVTRSGGDNNFGVLFEYDIATNTLVKKIDFDRDNNGSYPFGYLIQADNGKLYGMTKGGGDNDYGVIFEYDISSETYSKLLDFDGTNTGSNPYGSLMLSDNGKLYGMTYSGGANNMGVLFEYDPETDAYTKKLDFDGTNTGSYPQGALIQADNGKFYGLTSYGGVTGDGTLFEYDISTDTYTKKIDLMIAPLGATPYSSLMQADNGKLYGMTIYGGVNDDGVIFEFDPATDTYSKLFDFDRDNTGAYPYGDLIQADNGKLYGFAHEGGANDCGVMFAYDIATDSYTKLLDFDGSTTGKYPFGHLIQADNGKLYGITYSGGANNIGVLFEYDISTDTYNLLYNFEINSGENPHGSLIQASNGKLYGMTYAGGANNRGVIYEYDISTDTYTDKFDFDGTTTGKYPYGHLIQADNGKLYGMTKAGGANNYGVMFEYDISTDTYSKILDFDGTNTGSNPYGSLMQAANGKLYGMTKDGGVNDLGVIFEYDPASDTYEKKIDLDSSMGFSPRGTLIEVVGCSFSTSNIDTTVCNSYTVPSGDTTYTVSGTYEDRILNSCGSDSIITINLTIDTVNLGVTRIGDTLIANQDGASYQWIDCDNNDAPISGATEQQFVPTTTGRYAVIVSLNSCTDTSSCYPVFISSFESYSDNISIYPNPTTGNIKIIMSQKPVSVSVVNMVGEIIYETEKTDMQMSINISNYANSVYFIKIKTTDGISTYKIIKQ